MNSVIPTILMNLLSTTLCCQLYAEELDLVNRMNGYFHFDHNIFLIDTSIDLSCWFSMPSTGIKLGNFTPQTIYTGDYLSASGVDNNTKTSKNSFIVVVSEDFSFENDSSLWAQVKVIRQIDHNVKIGVFFASNMASLDIVEKLFRWSWSVGIVNIFSAFHLKVNDSHLSFNVFKYSPFGSFDLIDVTNSENLRQYFPDKVPTYRKNRLAGIFSYGGLLYDMNFWDAVVSIFNASKSETAENPDINPCAYSIGVSLPTFELSRSLWQRFTYPHRQSTLVVLVPHAQPYSDFVVYLQNETWTHLFVYTLIVIATSSFLLIASGFLWKKKILIFQSVTDVVNLLMNDNAGIRYQNLHRADVFVIVPLTFTGLIVMNGIVSVFQSYITSPIYQPQINNLKELYTSSVPILIEGKNSYKLFESRTGYLGWKAKFQVVDSKTLTKEKDGFSNSIAFVVNTNDAHEYLELQKRLGLKAYHLLSGTSFTKTFISYLVDLDFPFTEPIKDMVHQLNSAGLIDKWYIADHENRIRTSWIVHRKSQMLNESAESNYFVLTVVGCGWVASGIVFICENIWSRLKSDKSKN